MVVSILDNDLYKFSMGYAYMRLYPQAEGRFEFNDRNKTVFTPSIVSTLKEKFKELANLSLSEEEMNWAIKTMPYIPAVYWEWLRGFRFDSEKIHVYLDELNHLRIDVTDKLYKVTLYEVPILATVSEVVNRVHVINEADMLRRLDEKIALSNEHQLTFSEFGTRRRFSYDVQEAVVARLKFHAHYCVGTSNVYLARKYGMKPIGTVAHEWIMFHGSNFGYRRANYEAYEAWSKVFDGALGIALSDTFTTDAFLRNFSLKQAKLFDGIRQDSGNEMDFVYKVVDRYKELGVDPMLKTIVFSNALDFPKFKEIAEFCKGKIGKCSAGIGTNLTNDTGFKPMNIVMKLAACRMNPKQDWLACVKISDDKGKVMGEPQEIATAKYELGLSD
jgi:nicotinate phosphoribosyltransferase